MNKRTYVATARKLHAAYVALEKVKDTALFPQNERIAEAMDALRAVPDQLKVQVCTKCNDRGYYSTADNPYVSHTCRHDMVPTIDIRFEVQL